MGKAFEKQTKVVKDQGEEQVNASQSLESSEKQLPLIKHFISKERLNPEIANKIEKIEEKERNGDRSKMVYEGSNRACAFKKFKTLRLFGNKNRNNIVNMSTTNDEQNQLSKHIRQFKSKRGPQNCERKKSKENLLNSGKALLKGREMVFKAFESGILLKTEELKQGKGLKVLAPKQMYQRLPIALSKLKAVNNSESLLSEIRRISAPTWNEDFKLPDGSYSISNIQDHFEYILKKHSENVENPSIRSYVNKFENEITLKIKNGCYLEL